jgi:hypothetical protein
MFFLLKSLDQNVIGKTDGVSQINIDYSKVAPDFSFDTCLPQQVHKHFGHCRAIAPFKLVSPRTKLTDFCFSGETFGRQRVISPRVKSILENFSGFSSSFLPVQIFDHHETCHNYHLLHFQEMLSDKFIDFEKTTYSVFDSHGIEIDEIVGQSKSNQNPSTLIRVKRFVFKRRSDFPDFFLSDSTLTRFVSSKLADKLIAAKVSGINIYKYDNQSDLGVNTMRKANTQVY